MWSKTPIKNKILIAFNCLTLLILAVFHYDTQYILAYRSDIIPLLLICWIFMNFCLFILCKIYDELKNK